MLLSLIGMSFADRLPDDPAFPVEMVGLYWHFVDIVWIIIFTVVYLIPTAPGGGSQRWRTSRSIAATPRSRSTGRAHAGHPSAREYVRIFFILGAITAVEVGDLLRPRGRWAAGSSRCCSS